MNPGIDAAYDKANNGENEEDNDESDLNNIYATVDDEYGDIIMNDGPI